MKGKLAVCVCVHADHWDWTQGRKTPCTEGGKREEGGVNYTSGHVCVLYEESGVVALRKG